MVNKPVKSNNLVPIQRVKMGPIWEQAIKTAEVAGAFDAIAKGMARRSLMSTGTPKVMKMQRQMMPRIRESLMLMRKFWQAVVTDEIGVAEETLYALNHR